MASQRTTSSSHWTSTQGYVFGVICLLLGIAVGFIVRGTMDHSSGGSAPATSSSPAATAAGTASIPGMGGMNDVTPQQLAEMGRKKAAPMLQQLQADPNNAALLAEIGNTYYDTQQFREAATYYERSLKVDPRNPGVHADLGTCYWYDLKDADRAIAEYQKALSYDPTYAGALFNLGLVRWQGKNDNKGAIEAWQKLLQTNPAYPEKDKVQELITKAQQQAIGDVGGKPAK